MLDYIVDPFLPDYDPNQAHKHSNHWKTKAIAECLHELGFVVDVTHWENYHAPPARDYQVVVGHGCGYEVSCAGSAKGCKRIYLGTIAYMDQIVRAERERLRNLYQRRGVRCQRRYFHRYTRDRGPALSDVLMLLGSDWVIDTFRDTSAGAVHRWANVVVDGVQCTLHQKNFAESRKHFLWLSGYAAVHRGLDVLLEVFAACPEWHLWICGSIESERDFMTAYRRELQECPNIHFQGWTDVTETSFQEITARCGYAIYPSASDAMAGALVNCMASGLVPLTTREAGTDTGGFGELITHCHLDTVRAVIDRAVRNDPDRLRRDSEAVEEFARRRYSQAAFLDAFQSAFRAELT